jgi:hypothetical protein
MMQTMQYVLKTGFGEPADSYGGTALSLLTGLGQGSSASPTAFMALSSLIVNAYHQMGHGAHIELSYVFNLCAVMYVDDTDLLHSPESPVTDPEALIHHVQMSTSDCGHLAQASGGILKEKKCSVYFLAYKFVHGWAWLMSLCYPSYSNYSHHGGQ